MGQPHHHGHPAPQASLPATVQCGTASSRSPTLPAHVTVPSSVIHHGDSPVPRSPSWPLEAHHTRALPTSLGALLSSSSFCKRATLLGREGSPSDPERGRAPRVLRGQGLSATRSSRSHELREGKGEGPGGGTLQELLKAAVFIKALRKWRLRNCHLTLVSPATSVCHPGSPVCDPGSIFSCKKVLRSGLPRAPA